MIFAAATCGVDCLDGCEDVLADVLLLPPGLASSVGVPGMEFELGELASPKIRSLAA